MVRCGGCGARLEPLTGNCEEFGGVPVACYADPEVFLIVLCRLLKALFTEVYNRARGDWLALCEVVSEVIKQQQHGVIDGRNHCLEASDGG